MLNRRLILLVPLLVCASCSLLFQESNNADDGGNQIDGSLPPDLVDAGNAIVSCNAVMDAGAIGFEVLGAALPQAPSGMTGMAVAHDALYLVDTSIASPPVIWVTNTLTEWKDASLLMDGRMVRSIDVGAAGIVARLNEVSAPLAFAPNLGTKGSLLLVHENGGNLNSLDPLVRRIARYDFASDDWFLLPGGADPVLISHSLSVLDTYVYGIQHAGDTPIIRVTLEGMDYGKVELTRPSGILGSDPTWMSRAAQLTAGNGLIYGIKNDKCDPTSPVGPNDDCLTSGQRLFSFDPANFTDDTPTPVKFSAPLPFEIGHGSTLVFVPDGWSGRVGPKGALFMTNGRAPSDLEGLAPVAGNEYAIYDIECEHWLSGALPSQSGSGASAVFYKNQIVVHPGGNPDTSSSNQTLWVTSGP